MGKNRGFKLGTVLKRGIRRRTTPLQSPKAARSCMAKAVSKLCDLGRSLKHGAKGLCFTKSISGYNRVGRDPIELKPASVPKGHLAVYVGETEYDTCRYLVPVIFFNHPLFWELLREAEEVYGYDHPGRIQIPCPASEFEHVRTKIAATGGGNEFRRRGRWRF